MKKLFYWAVPVKSFTAMIFAGFIILYMIVGFLYAIITSKAFEYVIPFMYAIQAAALSVIISVAWTLIFSDVIVKKMRYFKRLMIFTLSLIPVLAISFWIFNAVGWNTLWLIIGGLIIVGLIIISILFETYLNMIGRQYTDVLKNYQANIK